MRRFSRIVLRPNEFQKRRIAAVSIDDNDPLEAVIGEALAYSHAELNEMLMTHMDGARIIKAMNVVAVRNIGRHQYLVRRAPARLEAKTSRDEVVHIQGQVGAMLLR